MKSGYTVAFAFLIPWLLARIFWRSWREQKHRERWTERLGFYPSKSDLRRPLWVHAVSVGESMAAAPMIKAIRERFPHLDLVISNTTLTGSETVYRLFGDEIRQVYFPYDLPFCVNRFLDEFDPRMLLLLETELWPNTLSVCTGRRVPVLLVNGRLSEVSLRSYKRVSSLSLEMVKELTCVAAQSDAHARRFIELGAEPEKVHVTGSLKFDFELPPSLYEQAAVLRRSLDVNRPVLMFGSTREGEENIILESLQRLYSEFRDLLVVIAPRHPERFDAVAAMCRQAGLNVARHSNIQHFSAQDNVLIVDRMGELTRYYAACDIAFVGGSLLPYGGHNILEPAALGKPVLSGCHTFNFAETAELLAGNGAMVEVGNADDLADAAERWLLDSNERDRVGRIGQELVRQHGGATQKTLELVVDLMVETEVTM
ncbi:MAG: lipid IV(A) 3-deoxy-D-manno-octulosonic acid transferase [Gammaproteobacteria bacterium]